MSGAPIAAARPALWLERKIAAEWTSRVDLSGQFEGYASLFNLPDLSRDVVEPGAFTASLARRGTRGIRLLWQHEASEPIGQWLILREDSRGLFVRGRLSLAVARARETLALMRDGAVDGLSIGFRTVKARTDPRSGHRRISQIDLWEISIVTFPMLPQARISAVKAMPPAAPSRACVA
jgi:HK97 family phage prohead protease